MAQEKKKPRANFPPPSRAVARYAPAGAALVAGYFAFNYILNAFYGQGQLIADAGWFAGLIWRSDWGMPHPVAVRDFIRLYTDDFFDIHISPLLITANGLSRLLPLSSSAWLALFLGAGAALIAACFAAAAADFLRFHCGRMFERQHFLAAAALAAGAVLGLNPIVANILVYPHFEIYIPAFLLLFLLMLAADRRKSALAALAALLAVRGDAGFHLSTLLWTAAGYLCLREMRGGLSLREAVLRHRRLLWWSLPAFLHAALFTFLFGRDLPFWTDPPDFAEAGSRLLAIVWRLEYTPLFLFLPFAAAYFRRPDWAIGFVAILPWIGLSLLSYSYAAHLEAYYAFPLVFALFWPLVSHRFVLSQKHVAGARRKTSRSPGAAEAAVFLLLLCALTFIRPIHDQSTVRSALVPLLQAGKAPPSSETRAAVSALGEFYKQNRRRMISDDTFASLFPHDVPAIKELGLNNDRVLPCGGDIMIINQAFFGLLSDSLYAATYAFGLKHWYRLAHTNYLLASAEPICADGACAGNLPLAEVDLSGWAAEAGARAHSLPMTWDGCALGAAGPPQNPEAGVAALDGNLDDKTLLIEPGAPVGVVAALRTAPLRGPRYFDIYYSLEEAGEGASLLMEIRGGASPLQVALPPRSAAERGGVGIVYDPGEEAAQLTLLLQYPGSGRLRLHRIQARPVPAAAEN